MTEEITLPSGDVIRVWRADSRTLAALLSSHPLRGIWHDGEVYVWESELATHLHASRGLGIDNIRCRVDFHRADGRNWAFVRGGMEAAAWLRSRGFSLAVTLQTGGWQVWASD